MKKTTRRKAIDEILAALPWRDRQRILQAGAKYRKPMTQQELEDLYKRAIEKEKQ